MSENNALENDFRDFCKTGRVSSNQMKKEKYFVWKKIF